jgi:hypothetical protein
MNKLQLNLDDLSVQSFTADASFSANGTAYGQADTLFQCPIPTPPEVYTDDDKTCQYTCDCPIRTPPEIYTDDDKTCKC